MTYSSKPIAKNARPAATRQFADLAADAAMLVSEAGLIEHASEGACRLLAPGASLLDQNIFTYVEPAGIMRLADAMRAAGAGAPTELMVTFRAAAGTAPMQVKVFQDIESKCIWLVGYDLVKSNLLAAETVLGQVTLEAMMPAAFRAGEFAMHYQPLVSPSGDIKGCEALMRWRRANGDYISPTEFIPAAERSGFILELGNYVLHEAVRQLLEFDAAGLTSLYMSINVSPAQLETSDFEAALIGVLFSTDLAPHRLVLEITEGVAMVNTPEVHERLARISAMGVRISLDDYGTGYSGLSYLRRYPVSTIKIDRSFSQGVEQDEVSVVIVQSIVNLAKALKLETVAEGVESVEQAQALLAMGVDCFQGFLYGKPMPAAELVARFAPPAPALT